MSQEDEIDGWVGGADIYRDPGYVDGTHPMDTDDVTWHHVWGKSSTGLTSESIRDGHWEKPPFEREKE